MNTNSFDEEKNPSLVTASSPHSALETWRWRIGMLLISFCAAWLVSGFVLMWNLVWKPLAVGHAALWIYMLISLSETMRRFYFRAIEPEVK